MDKVKDSEGHISSNTDRTSSPKTSSHRKQNHQHRKCERREKLNPNTSGHPIIHPDVEHAQSSDRRVFRLCEDSRPMFSPVPTNGSDLEGEDNTTANVASKGSPERPLFPAIYVERCENRQPSYSPSMSPHLPRHNAHTAREGHHPSPSRSAGPGGGGGGGGGGDGGVGGLNVPSPYLACQTEGRLLLMTHNPSRGLLGTWSRSEGNLPEAVSRSQAAPGGHSHLLDIRYRPSWSTGGATVRPSSDVSLHEMRRQGRGSPSPTRLSPTPTLTRPPPPRLEPLNPALGTSTRALSASHLQAP